MSSKILSVLERLCYESECDTLPEDILDRVGFNDGFHSGVDVSLISDSGKLKFMFTLNIPYERADYYWIDIDDEMLSRYFEQDENGSNGSVGDESEEGTY